MNDFLSDPHWYKDAVIYELHVRSFFDATNDGFGDFEGLRRKLPYLEGLGVNTLWLLPFLESPLKDDGYDTADYFKILPVHGSLDDFKAFLVEAHARGMRVITELVLNHTSDQHPWFKEARDPSSPKHDWYVWSDTTERYQDARIIFTDTEVSNWSWDRHAGKYYWHRFFSHQPDLNYDNPAVREAMKEVMFFWLDLGVDGLRLDAVPYLYEREGTSCENLPETIEYLIELRREIEARYGPGKILLAEANQWPEDTLPYFADGRGVQMAFNFPIMPRMYLALRRENRRPLVEMLELTKEIPEDAQWAIFLRNHDELTLEMVTDEERDYMYHEYAADPRFRINVGIRRRLAPLLGGERRRIELMNALLLSLKGSPILYYGDEIGMGDDPFLGDRNGVRTPMQWSPDKNGGFSRAPSHRLFMPTIGRGPYSYEFINVEDAENDPYSLLNFMKRLLALRRQHAALFGRGSFEVIPLENQHVIAYLRAYEGEQILVLANLSRFVQSVMLPPSSGLQGLVPVEMFSQSPFPTIGDAPYHLLLAPHGFLWLRLEQEAVVEQRRMPHRQTTGRPASETLPVLGVREGLHNLVVPTMVQDRGMERLEAILPEFVREQRWFGAKDAEIRRIHVHDAVRLRSTPSPIYLSIIDVETDRGKDSYLLPLMLSDGEAAEQVLERNARSAIAWLEVPAGRGLLHDATVREEFWIELFNWWGAEGKGRSLKGLYEASIDPTILRSRATSARLLSGEQSNSAAIIDGRYFAKLYRRLERGTNPEMELMSYFTRSEFKFVPRLLGSMAFTAGIRQSSIGILQEALPVESDGWAHALEIMERVLDRIHELNPPEGDHPTDSPDEVPGWLEDVAPEVVSLSRVLGIRTAEMHLALSEADEAALEPVAGDPEDLSRLVERIRGEAEKTREMLNQHADRFDALPGDDAWQHTLRRLDELASHDPILQKIRIHGDFHLGQVLLADGEFYLLDFEGEPARPLEERRQREHALRDVAGMLRSLEYVAMVAWQEHGQQDKKLLNWTALLVRWSQFVFLNAYMRTAEGAAFTLPPETQRAVLWAYLLDKVLYEVRYELNHRPDWTWIPLHGLTRLLSDQSIEQSPAPSATPSDG